MEIAVKRREQIVVGVCGNLLAGSAGLLVVGQQKTIAKNYAIGIYFVKSAYSMPRPMNFYPLVSCKISLGVAFHASVYVDGTEIDQIGSFCWRNEELACQVIGK